ncbi:hypothetical protein HMPREF0240_02703 [Clostridium sp. D5]|nr:hypothetical protein HMPREF0240_02703 [Clostridium sp. D5]
MPLYIISFEKESFFSKICVFLQSFLLALILQECYYIGQIVRTNKNMKILRGKKNDKQ